MAHLARWDPFGDLRGMQRELDQLFSHAGGAFIRRTSDVHGGAWVPSVDVLRRDEDMVIRAELPGVSPEEIDVEVTGDTLTLKGERAEEKESEEEGYVIRERTWGSFERTLSIPEGVDPASVTADCRDGILEIVVPNAYKELEPKTTKVEIGKSEE